MKRVSRVAFDTARGRSLILAGYLYRAGPAGMSIAGLSILTGHSQDRERTLLQYMKRIGVVEVYNRQTAPGVSSRPKWRLTTQMSYLYRRATEVFESVKPDSNYKT